MEIDAGAAAAESRAGGQTQYFCSTQCRQKFEADPSAYAAAGAASSGRDKHGDVHERNLTKKGGVTAPRFGSAGSGGLEYEGPPGRTGE
jgi:YHS domain-containing protein